MDAQAAQSLLNFAEKARSGLSSLEAEQVLGQLEHQYGELLAALEWFMQQEQTDEALRLAISLAPFWQATKRLDEGLTRFTAVIALPDADPVHHGRALCEAGLLAFWTGNDARIRTISSSLSSRPEKRQSYRYSPGLKWPGQNCAAFV